MSGEPGDGRVRRVVGILAFVCLGFWCPAGLSVAGEMPAAPGVTRPDSLVAWSDFTSVPTSDDPWSDGFRFEGGPNGYVRAQLEFEGQLVAVGGFSAIGGVALNRVGRWDGTTWRPMGTGLPSSPRALAVYNGQLFAGAYRWDGESWTNVLQTDAGIYALAVQGDDLIAAGVFTQACGQPANHILRWDGSAVHSLGDGCDDVVNALAVSEQGLFAGGRFTRAGGLPAARVARWDGESWLPLGEGIGAEAASVAALAVFAGDLIAGGLFSTAGGQAAYSLARWDGTAWHPLEGDIRGLICYVDMFMEETCWCSSVATLLARGSELLVGGTFVRVGDQAAINVAGWDGERWRPLGAGLGADEDRSAYPTGVTALATFGDRLVASGLFANSGSEPLSGIASWDGAAWSGAYPFGLGVDGEIRAILADSGRLIAAGGFRHAGDLTVGGIAAFDGENWAPLGGSGVIESDQLVGIFALVQFEGDLIAAGYFDQIDGLPARNIARWDGFAWHAMGDGVPQECRSLAVHDGTLYAGAGTLWWSTTFHAGLYRWDGTAWQCEVVTNGERIAALASYGGELVVGGRFGVANGDSLRLIFSWDGVTCHPLGGGIQGSGVHCLSVQGDDLLVGGGFYTAGGVDARYIARWDGAAWSGLGSGLSGASQFYGVYDLIVQGEQVYAVGNFTSAGGKPANRVALWSGGEWRGFGGGIPSGLVYAAALLHGDLYAGGEFTRAGTRLADNFARCPEAELPACLFGLAACREGRRARLTWQVAGGIGAGGYHVWRQEAEQARVCLTATPLDAVTIREFVDRAPPAGAADYWVQELTGTASEIWYGPAHVDAAPPPERLALAAGVPNPFNPLTTIGYSLPAASRVTLAVYDGRGRLVRTLVSAEMPAGEQSAEWNGVDAQGRPAASGIYVLRLTTSLGTRVNKVTLTR